MSEREIRKTVKKKLIFKYFFFFFFCISLHICSYGATTDSLSGSNFRHLSTKR